MEGEEAKEGGKKPVEEGDLSFGKTGVEKAVMEVAAVSPNGGAPGGNSTDKGVAAVD